MKKLGDILLTRQPFSEIVMGNTALVRAMIEAGVQVATSYPGSPTPEIASAILSIPAEKRPFYFEFSTNEKVATEVAYGAAVNGHLSTVFFKSVGLNVAADTFVQLNHMNVTGGMVVVLGDDPGANSSQNEQDNRHYAQLSYTPVFEPATPAEVYSFYLEAARLAVRCNMPVILRMTTHVCHAKEKVSFNEFTPIEPDRSPRFDPDNGPYIPIAAHVYPMKRIALSRLKLVENYAETSGLNTIVDNGSERGIITMGLPFMSVRETLIGLDNKPDILKLGVIYPIPAKLVKDFLTRHKEVKIIEELDDVLEKDVKTLAYDERIETKIIGKMDQEDWVGEYTPDKVLDVLRKTWPDMFPGIRKDDGDAPYVPMRPAQLCPGCGHRSAFHAIRNALKSEDITVADIGCHTLGFQPPYRMGQLLMCMGASSGMAAGLSLFNTSRKVVAFLGDSTFFHAGLPGVINALFNRHNFTLIIMENGTTAMTGHQDHAGSGSNVNGPVDKIPIRRVLEGLGVGRIYETDTYNQSELTSLVKDALDVNEFSVVIARHPCMLKFTRRQRKMPGYQPRKVEIDQDKCERIHECVSNFGCPSFQIQEDGRVEVNWDLCIGDGSCLQTCPSQAINPPRTVNE